MINAHVIRSYKQHLKLLCKPGFSLLLKHVPQVLKAICTYHYIAETYPNTFSKLAHYFDVILTHFYIVGLLSYIN